MGKPKAPKAPDPKETAAASTGTNVGTGIANAFMQNYSTVDPAGSTTFDVTGNYTYTDPYTGQSYDIPTFTATQQLSPDGQQIFDLYQQTQGNLGQLGADQSASLIPYMNERVDLSKGAVQDAMFPGVDLSQARGEAGMDVGRDAIYGQLGDQFAYGDLPNVDALGLGLETEQRLFDLGSRRLDPMFERREDRLRQRLADQGIQQESDAFSTAMQDFGQERNDAYNNLALTGRAQAANEIAREGQFDLSRRQQGVAEALAARGQQMSDRGQALNELMAGWGTGMDARQQMVNELLGQYGVTSADRTEAMNRLMTERNQPLNEIGALLSGSQVQQPIFAAPNIGAIPTTDTGGIINQDYANRYNNYTNQMGLYGDLMGGLFSLGAARIGR